MLKRILLILSLVFLPACGPEKGTQNALTVSRDRIHVASSQITPAELRELFPNTFVYVFDESYAPFNEDYLPKLHDEFLNTMSRLGLSSQWRLEFDCDSFATLKMGVAQALYTVHSFHDFNPPQSVAIGEVAYRVGGTGGGHMINAIVVREKDGGLRVKYVDIYSGKIQELSGLEKMSIWYVGF